MITCPNCGKSRYIIHYSTCTAMGWTPIIENGVPQNNNPNIQTTHCTCLICNHRFSYTEQYGEVQDITDDGPTPEIPHYTMSSKGSSLLQTEESPSNCAKISVVEKIEKQLKSLNKEIQELKEVMNTYVLEKM